MYVAHNLGRPRAARRAVSACLMSALEGAAVSSTAATAKTNLFICHLIDAFNIVLQRNCRVAQPWTPRPR